MMNTIFFVNEKKKSWVQQTGVKTKNTCYPLVEFKIKIKSVSLEIANFKRFYPNAKLYHHRRHKVKPNRHERGLSA